MRAYGISVGILAAILVFSLWNSSYMTASTVRWREQLQQADAQAQSEAWTEAVDTLAGSYDDWSESQTTSTSWRGMIRWTTRRPCTAGPWPSPPPGS